MIIIMIWNRKSDTELEEKVHDSRTTFLSC